MARDRESRWEDLRIQVDGKTFTGRWTNDDEFVTVRYASGSTSIQSGGADVDEVVARRMLLELLEAEQTKS
jgi:hypothetical protein